MSQLLVTTDQAPVLEDWLTAPHAKLDFYDRWGVQEYLEADLETRTVRLWQHTSDGWAPTSRSTVLGLDVAAVATIVTWP